MLGKNEKAKRKTRKKDRQQKKNRKVITEAESKIRGT